MSWKVRQKRMEVFLSILLRYSLSDIVLIQLSSFHEGIPLPGKGKVGKNWSARSKTTIRNILVHTLKRRSSSPKIGQILTQNKAIFPWSKEICVSQVWCCQRKREELDHILVSQAKISVDSYLEHIKNVGTQIEENIWLLQNSSDWGQEDRVCCGRLELPFYFL